MATFMYFSFIEDVLKGNINVQTGTFKAMLMDSVSFVKDQSHTKRSNLAGQCVDAGATGSSGYPADGFEVDLSVSRTGAITSISIPTTLLNAPVSTATAPRYLVVYHARGGAASADELVCCFDGGATAPTNGTTYTAGVTGSPTITVPIGT